MKIILNFKESKTPENEDVVIFRNGKYTNCDKNIYLRSVTKEITALKEENLALREELDSFKSAVNKKLEEYHNILQVLTKEK